MALPAIAGYALKSIIEYMIAAGLLKGAWTGGKYALSKMGLAGTGAAAKQAVRKGAAGMAGRALGAEGLASVTRGLEPVGRALSSPTGQAIRRRIPGLGSIALPAGAMTMMGMWHGDESGIGDGPTAEEAQFAALLQRVQQQGAYERPTHTDGMAELLAALMGEPNVAGQYGRPLML